MNATHASTYLRTVGLDAILDGDVLLVSRPWSPDQVTTIPVRDDFVDQWRVEDAMRTIH